MADSLKTTKAVIPNRNIVILGNFNPVIIQPSFLRSCKILPEQEISAAEDVTHKEETGDQIIISARRFAITGSKTVLVFQSFLFDVTREKFQVSLKPTADTQTALDGLRKLFLVLRHTPVTAVGFNCNAHWKATGAVSRLNSLFTGEPKTFKSTFGNNVSVGGKIRFEDLKAKVLFQTEKSLQYDHDGVHFSFNFHYDIADKRAETLVELLRNFDKAMERAKVIATTLYGKPVEVFMPPDVIEIRA